MRMWKKVLEIKVQLNHLKLLDCWRLLATITDVFGTSSSEFSDEKRFNIHLKLILDNFQPNMRFLVRSETTKVTKHLSPRTLEFQMKDARISVQMFLSLEVLWAVPVLTEFFIHFLFFLRKK